MQVTAITSIITGTNVTRLSATDGRPLGSPIGLEPVEVLFGRLLAFRRGKMSRAWIDGVVSTYVMYSVIFYLTDQ